MHLFFKGVFSYDDTTMLFMQGRLDRPETPEQQELLEHGVLLAMTVLLGPAGRSVLQGLPDIQDLDHVVPLDHQDTRDPRDLPVPRVSVDRRVI